MNEQNKLILKSSSFTYTDSNKTLRTGSKVTRLQGTLYYNNGAYSITPTVQPVFSGNERTSSPGDVGVCNLKVASFNVEYYIATKLFFITSKKCDETKKKPQDQ